MKIVYLLIIFCTFSFSNEKYIEQRNVLYTQNLVNLEEKLAKEYERYLLTNFKIPTMSDLVNDKFLGTNFSDKNLMGEQIDFKDAKNLKLKFGISRKAEDYMVEIYKRDLYRNRTSVYMDGTNTSIDLSKSYVEIILKDEKAKTIHSILKDGYIIRKNCQGTNKTNVFCSINEHSIRWYFNDSSWIEYNKKLFTKGNITIKNVGKTNSKLNNLKVGVFVFEENGSKYIKLANNQIMKVE